MNNPQRRRRSRRMARTYFRLDSHKMLDALLDKAGISNATAGAACGHGDGSYVGRLRSGQRRTVAKQTAEKLAEILGVDIDVLFSEHATRDVVASSSRRVSKSVAMTGAR